jgi:hypothetical protein
MRAPEAVFLAFYESHMTKNTASGSFLPQRTDSFFEKDVARE